MTIRLVLVEDDKSLGEYEFQHVPAPSDRVVIPAPSSDLDIMQVLYVEHSPVPTELRATTKAWADAQPHMAVYVKFVDRYTGAE